ncbi:unnamed protein product [Amoebophrya sp. A25]|nr:unnamed protein product [Amoebophrya sp. A25]|eukprot:GSA25T00020238001.1
MGATFYTSKAYNLAMGKKGYVRVHVAGRAFPKGEASGKSTPATKVRKPAKILQPKAGASSAKPSETVLPKKSRGPVADWSMLGVPAKYNYLMGHWQTPERHWDAMQETKRTFEQRKSKNVTLRAFLRQAVADG